MKAVAVALITLAGCSQSDTFPGAETESCIENQVPNGTKVSAKRALEVVQNCDNQFDAWSKATVENTFQKPFDRSNPQMSKLYELHQEASRETMLVQISDEIHPKFYK
ncbi:hypothetical protein [Aurantiacibacter xanthus]|uniref:hypothetical protein n=1 Tax=Aurantiacibacter xanthus TaxID=1784712 RepID=UPI0011C23F6E|nr:hypothetical protein [Aurantiacibacter xanthus]